jgi:hypothetical protein
MPSYPTPSPIPDPSTLKKLVIDGTGLRDLPDLTIYPVLEELSVINGHWLTNVTLPSLPNLRFLSIIEGTLETIDLSNVTGLEELYLYKNQISNIDVSMLTKLKTLDIRENNITDISSAADEDLTSLYYVDVAYNFLDLFAQSVMDSINAIKKITTDNDGEIYYEPQDTLPAPPTLYGDTNKDGIVNTTDLLWLRRYIAGGYTFPTPFDEEAANVYYDGGIGLDDIIILRRFLSYWYPSLPQS